MAIDRNAALKQAEKLLRQGKLDGAIDQYVRLIEEEPEDWNAINALGDLYLRANKHDLAADQFVRVGDHQFSEGFFSKAAALYKKALKVKPEDEHIFLQLAAIGERQGKFVDAKLYLQKVAAIRQSRGEEEAAAECILRLGSFDGADLESKIAAARAAQQIGDAFRAVELLKEASHDLEKEDRRNDAFQLLAEAAEIDPFDPELRNRLAREFVAAGQPGRARAYLSAETAGDDPDLLLALATIEFADGKEDDARMAVGRVLALAPDREPDVMRLSAELVAGGRAESAFVCIDAITDAALLQSDVPRAMTVLQKFIDQAPYIPALSKLIDLLIDADLPPEQIRQAQGKLADAYLAASQGAEARVIAEDLLRAEPSVEVHADRLRLALVLLGVGNPDKVIAQVLGVEQEEDEEELGATSGGAEGGSVEVPRGASTAATAAEGPSADTSEIDLTGALSGLTSSVASLGEGEEQTAPAPDIEVVFAEMRAKAAREQQASAALTHYEQGLQYIEQGLVKEAIEAFETAARVPLLRFRAAARLGRVFIDHGDLADGIEWFERAAEAPAPTPEEGFELLYDLAGVLEIQGETARALAVLMELDAESEGYRNVREWIAQLTRDETGSPQS